MANDRVNLFFSWQIRCLKCGQRLCVTQRTVELWSRTLIRCNLDAKHLLDSKTNHAFVIHAPRSQDPPVSAFGHMHDACWPYFSESLYHFAHQPDSWHPLVYIISQINYFFLIIININI
jgi:hypothetical protein